MTDWQEVLRALADGDEQERLIAARQLRSDPQADAVPAIQAALATERVRWTRIALEEALERCGEMQAGGSPSIASEGREVSEDLRQAYADGRREGLRQAIHELAPLVGLARLAAQPAEAVGSDELRKQLDRMRAVVSALRQLVTAAAVPEQRDFDLAELVFELRAVPPAPSPKGLIGVIGTSPFVVRGDRDLLELALNPVVANAIEAVLSVDPQPPRRSVLVSWGAEAESFWIAVLDRGPGPELSSVGGLTGGSTKDGHFGLGLQTARTAIASLGGTLELERNNQGGAKALLRWPRWT